MSETDFVTARRLNTVTTNILNRVAKKITGKGLAANLTTTDAGYALDASMGKELSDSIGRANSKIDDIKYTDLVRDFNVFTSSWVGDSTYQAAGYKYRADITVNECTADMIADMVLPISAIALGTIAPFCNTGSGVVSIYASAVPNVNFTIKRISLRKKVVA